MSEQKKEWRTPSFIPAHIELYLKDPERAHMWDSSAAGGPGPLPTLLLTTKGRKSGETRHSPLLYQKAGKGYAVIASKGGWADNPAWYLNLEGNPEAEIRVGRERMRVRARTAKGAERTKIWQDMAKMYPPYNDYQARAKTREIPVIMLEPV